MLKGKKEAKNIRHTQLSPNYDFLSSVTNLNNITSNCLHLVSYAIPIRVLLFEMASDLPYMNSRIAVTVVE